MIKIELRVVDTEKKKAVKIEMDREEFEGTPAAIIRLNIDSLLYQLEREK